MNPNTTNPGLYQHLDGTVFKLREDGSWQYLSPLFGEWLDVFTPNVRGLDKYPRNIEVPKDMIDAFIAAISRR
jgi:hypothetical protein